MSSQNPQDPDKIASNNKVIVLSMKNMPSFKFDPSKGFLTVNPQDSPQVFNVKTQQLSQPAVSQPVKSTQSRVQVCQQSPKGGIPILIRTPVAPSTSKSQFTPLNSHPNVKIQENDTSRQFIATNLSKSSVLAQNNRLYSASKQISETPQTVAKIVGMPAGAVMLSTQSSNNVTLASNVPSGVKGITITSSSQFSRITSDNSSKTKPVLIRPKVDAPRIIEHHVLVPAAKFQLIGKSPPGLTKITQSKSTAGLEYQFSQPSNSRNTAPIPALTLIKPKPQCNVQEFQEEKTEQILQQNQDRTLQEENETFIESSSGKVLELVPMIPNFVVDEQVQTDSEYLSGKTETLNCAGSSSTMLLCNERITEVSPNGTSASNQIQVTPDKVFADSVSLATRDVKQNLDQKFSMDCDNENVDFIIEDATSEEFSLTDSKHQIQDYEESSRGEVVKPTAITPPPGVHSKAKRIRKPKNPTIIATLGLPFKASQPTFRKSKVEKKLEFELDFHDPLNKIQWEDGIGGLNNCNKLFGFDEFGLIEVLNMNDAIAKLKQLDMKESFEGASYKLRKITDPADHFTCSVCTKAGTIRDFFSPECCSESCMAITKRKSNELGLSMGRESSSESGLNTPVDERKLIFGGEAIPLQQLQQHLLEQQLPTPKQKRDKKQNLIFEQKFQWDTYLSEKSLPAPLKLFKKPYPSSDNPFKVGMKLEAIDPANQKMICVCTVDEKLGYRIKLHFDGYPNCYDFWINCDSPNIFPTGFCHSTNRQIQTPPKWSNKKFDWSEYLDFTNSIGALRCSFPHISENRFNADDSFEIGMKLETTRDGKIYAASIIDKIGDRILISHDGHEELPCIWLDIRSPYLHPCNYHKTVDDPECFIPPSRPFDWKNYLTSTAAKEAPAKILFFGKRAPKEFEPGSKIEIVDCVNRQLIRPATVLCQKDYKIQVIFDGFNISFAFWVEDDSEDIHPINWCEKTNHPIENPAGFNKSIENGLCLSPGCRGIGNAMHKDRYFHDNIEECPYVNWKKLMNSKVGSHLDYKAVGKRGRPSARKESLANKLRELKCENDDVVIDFDDEIPSETLQLSEKFVKKVDVKRKPSIDKSEEENLVKAKIAADFLKDYGPQVNYAFKLWRKNSKVLSRPDINGDFTGNPLQWNAENVCSFIREFVEDVNVIEKFREQEIDGEAFMSMCQDDMVDLMNIKLGFAVKIYNRIIYLRQEIMTKFMKI